MGCLTDAHMPKEEGMRYFECLGITCRALGTNLHESHANRRIRKALKAITVEGRSKTDRNDIFDTY